MSNIFPNYIVIEQIKYHKKTNKIEIYVTSDDFIKEEIILEKTVQIKEELSLNELEIISSYKISSDDTDKLKRYENILRVRINETFPSTKELNGHLLINYNKENNCYDITIVKSAIYNLLMKKDAQNVLNKIIKKQINLDITANIILDEEEIDMQEYEKNQELENTSITANLINVKEIKQEKQKTQDAPKKVEIKGESVPISQIKGEFDNVIITGEVFNVEKKILKNNKTMITFIIGDDTDAIYCKRLINEKNGDSDMLSNGQYIKASGKVEYDQYKKDFMLNVQKSQELIKIVKKDLSPEKMVELHAHTTMSQMDGLTSVKELIKRIKGYGHTAIGIADHAVVQAYPEIMEVANKQGIKPIYGCEFYITEDTQEHIKVRKTAGFNDEYVVFDIETTGFSNKNDAITEIGAVKIKNCEIVDTFSQLINPKRPIPEKIQKLTGITDELVADKPFIEEVLPNFLEFCSGSVLVAHNSDFDTGFIREKSFEQKLDYDFDAIDTLVLSRLIMTELKNHKLNTIAKKLDIPLENHHRAVDDATATAHIFLKFIEKLKNMDIENFNDINNKIKHRRKQDKAYKCSSNCKKSNRYKRFI